MHLLQRKTCRGLCAVALAIQIQHPQFLQVAFNHCKPRELSVSTQPQKIPDNFSRNTIIVAYVVLLLTLFFGFAAFTSQKPAPCHSDTFNNNEFLQQYLLKKKSVPALPVFCFSFFLPGRCFCAVGSLSPRYEFLMLILTTYFLL